MAAQPFSSTLERSPFDGQRMSLEEYEQLEEVKPYLEYWDGVVYQKGVPKKGHVFVADELLAALRDYRRRHGGKSGPEGHIWFEGRGYRVPDVVYWAPGRHLDRAGRLLPPTLAVEIRSIGESIREQREKCQEMCVQGVEECWLVDPDQRWIEVIRLDALPVRLPPDGVIESEHLPGFELPITQLWRDLDDEQA